MCADFDVVFSPLSSLQPNQPGVLQVDVDDDVDVVFGVVPVVVVVVVVSSKQPHHPGVLQVSVLVRVLLVEVAVGFEVLDVVVSVPLLSK
jgi:multisubunit Na+/H+ antiporter MnhE subunit